MGSVAEVWLADDLAGLEDDPSPRLQADLHRCARETGWTPDRVVWASEPYVIHHGVGWRAAREKSGVRMRVSVFAPVIGFVGGGEETRAWGAVYVDAPRLTSWWLRAGWLLPDLAWLNALCTASDLAQLDPWAARDLRHWRELSRGDALFFEW